MVDPREQMQAFWRERRVLRRASRAAWRLEQARREHRWALASAHAEGVSVRKLGEAVGLSSSRVHQLISDADLPALDADLGELRAAGWPAPEDPQSSDDDDLDGQDQVADRLGDEVNWIRQCAAWLAQIETGGHPPWVNLRPVGDHPATAYVVVDLARVQRVLDRIAADVDELARARRVQDLHGAAVLGDRRAEHRRRVAEPDLAFATFCAREKLPTGPGPNLERAWDAWTAQRYHRGETPHYPDYHDNPFRPR